MPNLKNLEALNQAFPTNLQTFEGTAAFCQELASSSDVPAQQWTAAAATGIQLADQLDSGHRPVLDKAKDAIKDMKLVVLPALHPWPAAAATLSNAISLIHRGLFAYGQVLTQAHRVATALTNKDCAGATSAAQELKTSGERAVALTQEGYNLAARVWAFAQTLPQG